MAAALVSVIVPVYNVERYLKECLDSLLMQAYRELEIVLVDDGSTDSSGKICDEYAKKDRRIRVLHEKNGGAAAARNRGLDAAVGKYLYFMDSDDWLKADAIEVLYKALKESDADCAVGRSVHVFEKEDKRKSIKPIAEGVMTGCVDSQDAIKAVLLNGSAMWNRLFKSELFHEVRCPEGRINEDEPVMVQVYHRCQRIIFTEEETYFYRIRGNSVTTSSFSVKTLDIVKNSFENLEFVKDKYPVLIPCAEYKYLKSALYCYLNLHKLQCSGNEKREIRKELKSVIRGRKSGIFRNPYMTAPLKAAYVFCRIF